MTRPTTKAEAKAIPAGGGGADDRVLVLAPLRGDAAAICRVLAEAGFETADCADAGEVAHGIESGAAAAVLSEEALAEDARAVIAAALDRQPAWSDFPLLVLHARGSEEGSGWRALRGFEKTAYLLLLERPLHAVALTTAVRSAVESRRRQYQIRDHLAFRDRAEQLLSRERELLQRLVDTIPIMLVTWDPRLRRFTLNRHAERVLGWTTADANDGNFLEKVYPDPADREDVVGYMRSLSPGWREFHLTAKDGAAVTSDWANLQLADDTFVGIGVDLRDRLQAEQALARHTAVMTAITRIFREALSAGGFERLGEVSLAAAEELTQSRMGMLGEVNPDTGLLDLIAVGHGAGEAGAPRPPAGGRRLPVSLQIRGIHGEVIRNGKGFFTNDLGAHRAQLDLPAGHPPLDSFLGVPLIRKGETIGLMAVANRPGGYDSKQLDALESLAPAVVEALDRRRAEISLRQSREDLAYAQAVGRIGSWRLDVRRDEMTWSDETYRIFGVAAGTPATYDTFLRAVHPDDRERVDQQWSAALRGEPFDIEHRIVVDGAVRWVRGKAFLDFDQGGELRGGFGITQDITDRKEAEEKLRESKDFVDKILASSLNGLYIYDLVEGATTFANRSFTRLTGFTRDEINAFNRKGFADRFYLGDRQRMAAHLRALQGAGDGEILRIEYRFRTKSGRWRWLLSNDAVFARDECGAVRQFVGTFMDITDRKQAEAALEEAQRLSAALNRIDAIIHASLEPEKILERLVSEGAAALRSESAAFSARQGERWIVQHVHGLPAALVGMEMSDDDERHAALALRAHRPLAIADALEDDRVNREHMREHNVRAVLVVPLIVSDEPLGVLFFNHHSGPRTFSAAQMSFANQLAATASIALQNIRLLEERVQREAELKALNETLEQQVAERTAVAERRALDLRRLAAELSNAEHVERKRLAQLLHDDLQQLLSAAKLRLRLVVSEKPDKLKLELKKLEDLIGDCIRTSRNLAQELSPPFIQHGTLSDVVDWLASWFRENYKLAVSIQTPGELPKAPEHLRVFLFQAVRELLMNVHKHARGAAARIAVSSRGSVVTIQVEDGGKNFDPRAVEDQLQWPKGFGLFNIRERLEALQGRLEIERTPGGGACFRLVVPVSEEAAGVPESAEPDETKPPAPGRVFRVLVADDHQVVRAGCIGLLGRQPEFHVVGEAVDGEQAVKQVEALEPDIVVMDIDLPILDGIQAARLIRERRPETTIVALSLYDDAESRRAMADAGATAHVSKHAPASELIATLRDICHRSKKRESPS